MAHSLTTAIAAPLNASQWREGTNEAAVASILQHFERWQALRAALQFVTFAVVVLALAQNSGVIGGYR